MIEIVTFPSFDPDKTLYRIELCHERTGFIYLK